MACVVIFSACNKVGSGSVDTGKAINGVRSAIGGKWKALFLVNTLMGDTITAPPGTGIQFNLGSTDSAYSLLNDSIKSRTAVTFEANQDLVPGLVVVVMDASPILPPLGVQGVFKDSLFMFSADADRIQYVYKRP